MNLSGSGHTLSDVASKPIFLEHDHWRAAARQMSIAHAMLIDAEGKIHITTAMQQRLNFIGQHAQPDVVP